MVISTSSRQVGKVGKPISTCTKPIQAPVYGQQYYVYSSGPKLSHADRPKRRSSVQKKTSGSCHAAHYNNIKTKGAHDFHNMMWDPTVYRGNTYKTFGAAELDLMKKKGQEEYAQSHVKRRRFPRRPQYTGGIIRPNNASNEDEEREKVGFGDMGMQTEKFLEEVTSGIGQKEMCTQFDSTEGEAPKLVYKPFMIGVSQKCQTEPTDKSCGDSVAPLQKVLTNKILEQSLIETTEEFELESIRKEKRAYIEWRREELYKLKRTADAQRAVAEQTELAKMRRGKEFQEEQEAEGRVGAALFASGCIARMLPITFKVMKIEGFMQETGSQDIYKMLIPWMDCEVAAYYSQRKIVSRKILDELMHHVTQKREAEFAEGMWNEMLLSGAGRNQSISGAQEKVSFSKYGSIAQNDYTRNWYSSDFGEFDYDG